MRKLWPVGISRREQTAGRSSRVSRVKMLVKATATAPRVPTWTRSAVASVLAAAPALASPFSCSDTTGEIFAGPSTGFYDLTAAGGQGRVGAVSAHLADLGAEIGGGTPSRTAGEALTVTVGGQGMSASAARALRFPWIVMIATDYAQ